MTPHPPAYTPRMNRGHYGYYDLLPDTPPNADLSMFMLQDNLPGNPMYTDPAHTAGDFELQYGSPALNSASDGSNIGAWQGSPPCIHTGDVNNDGVLTPDDANLAFQIYLTEYAPTYDERCAADCNGDGIISPGDALCIWKNYLSGDCQCVDPL